MTRRPFTVATLVALLLAAGIAPAVAAERYCGTGVKRTLTTSTYFVVTLDDGRRQMQVVKRWPGTRPSYFVCTP